MNVVRFPIAAMVFLISASVAPDVLVAQASGPHFWSVVGSTGIADESSTGLISFSDTGSVSIRSSIASGTAQLRYPVLPVGELANFHSGDNAFCLDVDYRDTGAGSRVIVSLKSVDGEEPTVTHLTFDSNAFPSMGTAYGFNHVCGPVNSDGNEMFTFQTLARAYYVDVQLVKGSSTANPGLKKIMIVTADFEAP
jgi:hypothetical protein